MNKNHLYIASRGNRPSKIGSTNNPQHRLRQLQRLYGRKMRLWRVWHLPDIAFDMEGLVKTALEPCEIIEHRTTEWFDVSPWVLTYRVAQLLVAYRYP